MREWSSHAKPGYPVTFGDATASGAALALLISRPYSFRTLGGNVDVHSLKQTRSRIRIGGVGGALSRRAKRPSPNPPPFTFSPPPSPRPWRQINPPPNPSHLP